MMVKGVCVMGEYVLGEDVRLVLPGGEPDSEEL